MSRRRIQAGFNATSSFSLRDCVVENNSSNQVLPSEPVHARVAKPVPNIPAISFALSPNPNTQPPSTEITKPSNDKPINLSGLSLKLSVFSNESASVTRKTPSTNNSFGMPMNTMAKQGNLGINPEVMRLSAQTDDLRSRLKVASDRSTVLESQVQRMQKITMKDRTEFAKQLNSARTEIKSLRECEAKLKAKVSEMTSAAEKKASFEIAVKTAMKSKEIVEAQSRVEELQKQAGSFSQQIDALEQKRVEVIADIQKYEHMKNEYEGLEDKIQTSECKLQDVNKEFFKAESELVSKRQEVDNIDDSIDMRKQELASVEALVSDLDNQKKKIEQDIASAKIECDLHCKKADHAQRTKTSVLSNVVNVTGDEHPSDMLLNIPTDSKYRRVDDSSAYSYGMPFHFDMDAPISLTGNHTQMIEASEDDGEKDTNTEAMLAAIVGDLKSFLAQASLENDKRGIDRGIQTGVCVRKDSETSVPLTECAA